MSSSLRASRAVVMWTAAGLALAACGAPAATPSTPAPAAASTSAAPTASAPAASVPAAPAASAPAAPTDTSPRSLVNDVPPPGAPGAPGGIEVRADAGAIVASWAAPGGAEPVVEYRAFSLDAGGEPVSQCNAAAPQTTCTLGDLIPGEYTVVVRALNDAGAGPISAQSKAVKVQ